jgi:ABC-type uncharacterized transport system permease subunit
LILLSVSNIRCKHVSFILKVQQKKTVEFRFELFNCKIQNVFFSVSINVKRSSFFRSGHWMRKSDFLQYFLLVVLVPYERKENGWKFDKKICCYILPSSILH